MNNTYYAVAEEVSDIIIKALLANKLPWRGKYGFPRNILTGQPYGGVNPLLLNLATERHGWNSSWWATECQWKALGGQLIRQPLSNMIVTFRTKKRQKVYEHFWSKDPILDQWIVYNSDQIQTGFDSYHNQLLTPEYSVGDKLIANSKSDIRCGVHKVDGKKLAMYYYPPDDYILLPPKDQFVNGCGGIQSWYHANFHELMHWTEPRLKWAGMRNFLLRELRAAIGAEFLCTHLNIPPMPWDCRTSHKENTPKWIKMMKEDPYCIIDVSNDACKGVDYLLSFVDRNKGRELPPLTEALK